MTTTYHVGSREKVLEEVPIAGYTDRLSARPGETVKYYISMATERECRVNLTRSICADPNPKGQRIVEEDASQYFEERLISVGHQPIPRGSYAQTASNLKVPHSDARLVSVEVWFYPTLISDRIEDQNVWSWGEGFRLDLKPTGQLALTYGSSRTETTVKIWTALKEKRWYYITSILELKEEGEISCRLSFKKQGNKSVESTSVPLYGSSGHLHTPDAPFCLANGGSLNGRLEDPKILVMTQTCSWIASWDTSCYHTPNNYDVVDPWTIPCSGEGSSLVLHHNPTRGVKGRRWDGTEFCWTKCPNHYGAIHFHDDDVYDFEWECDMEWKVPPGIPSGIYIMRFEAMNFTKGPRLVEALPIFICAPKIPASMPPPANCNKLVLLIPTFTYVMYGNHARPDFEKEKWLARTKNCKPKWNENKYGSYPYNPVLYPAYGHSSYDFHSDQTGITFASHLRPLFNLRPGYITFSRVGGYNDGDKETQQNAETAFCSGLRHFPADSHIVSWLHRFGYDFDVITDHELHREGAECLARYSTLLTCTHPEYHTPESLEALQTFRDVQGGNLVYLGGNGFYWKIGASPKAKNDDDDCKLLEIRRCEGGVRTWAAEAGEYYNLLDGNYGGLWRNSGRPPSKLAGIGFAAQGSFVGKPYTRVCFDRPDITDWVFSGISGMDAEILGDFGFSGDGAAGYELDRIDPNDELYRDGEIVILAQATTQRDKRYALVPEEVLTPWTNLAGTSNEQAKRADMIYMKVPSSGAQVFSVGSITFCGCLPYNNFNNPVSRLIKNVVDRFLEEEGVADRYGDKEGGGL